MDGYLLLPAPAEPHSHFDKVLTTDLIGAPAGDLDAAVRAWYQFRARVDPASVLSRARRAALMLVANGATAVRTHVDVGSATRCRLLEPVLELRALLESIVDLQVVAMVDVPVTGPAGAANRVQLRTALELGADVIGGAPYRDPDPVAGHEHLLRLADEFGVPIDVHTDETLDPDVLTLGTLPTLIRAHGYVGRVVASHCVSLGVQPRDVAAAVSAELAGTGIAVVACPATNLYLQGRHCHPAQPRGLTALSALRAAGVLVAAGGDNVADPFYPLGRGDPLETAALLVAAGHLPPDAAYDAVSRSARTAMGLPDVQIRTGDPAELLAIRATSIREAIADPVTDRIVIHRGRIVSTSRVNRDVYVVDSDGSAQGALRR